MEHENKTPELEIKAPELDAPVPEPEAEAPEQETRTPELDAFLNDLHRLLDDSIPAELPEEPDYDFDRVMPELNDPEPAEAAEPDIGLLLDETPRPAPVAPAAVAEPPKQEFHQTRWTDRQRVPRHVAKLQQNQEKAYADWLYEQEHRPQQAPPPPPPPGQEDVPLKKKKGHGLRNFLIFLVVLTLAVTAAVVFLLPRQPKTPTLEERKEEMSTLLILGTDASGARTDVVMLLSMDRQEKAISLVSIPRDTLVSGEYTVPKLNGVFAANNGGEVGMEMVMERVRQCVGFMPDGYLLVDLQVFREFIDTLGGVAFDVPVDMFYNDPSQDLYIALEAGYQTLDGEAAMGLVRFRSGYADADLGRVQVQRDFLAALMEQTISVRGVAKSPLLMNVLLRHCKTDLSASNLLWLAETAALCDLGSMETVTLPGSARTLVDGGSYYVLDPNLVAQTVNAYCNPYTRDITVADLEIRLN